MGVRFSTVGAQWRRVLVGAVGVCLGGLFLYLALKEVNTSDVETTVRQVNRAWLTASVGIYLCSIALRCLRWGILLRAAGSVKWRHATEALITGFAANYVLPGRIGELFRADYARRIFKMSRFTSLGTIVVERTCDGIVVVCALWISSISIFSTRIVQHGASWVLGVASFASMVFGAAVLLIAISGRIDLRQFGVIEGIAARWDRLVSGMSSVMRGNASATILCSIGIWTLESAALGAIVRSFGVSQSLAETVMLLCLATLSTLVPTAPGYVGTYQLVFGNVFKLFGNSETTGVIAATAVQIFFFGTVTILGVLILLSRSGVTLWRARE
jgi:glycosyltransferase 2 family protein